MSGWHVSRDTGRESLQADAGALKLSQHPGHVESPEWLLRAPCRRRKLVQPQGDQLVVVMGIEIDSTALLRWIAGRTQLSGERHHALCGDRQYIPVIVIGVLPNQIDPARRPGQQQRASGKTLAPARAVGGDLGWSRGRGAGLAYAGPY